MEENRCELATLVFKQVRRWPWYECQPCLSDFVDDVREVFYGDPKSKKPLQFGVSLASEKTDVDDKQSVILQLLDCTRLVVKSWGSELIPHPDRHLTRLEVVAWATDLPQQELQSQRELTVGMLGYYTLY